MLLEDHLLEVPEPLLLVVRLHLILDVKSDRASEQGESDQEQVSVASHASAATKRRGDSCVRRREKNRPTPTGANDLDRGQEREVRRDVYLETCRRMLPLGRTRRARG